MSSLLYQIRWINESKRYGLFATEDIRAGTRILREWAVILDIHQLETDVVLSRVLKAQDAALPTAMTSNLETQTQNILHGMQDLKEATKGRPKYEPAMNIHQERMENGTILERDAEDNVLVLQKPWIPMDLYKQVIDIKIPGSEDAITTILQKSLEQINTYLHGTVTVNTPECHVWGPYSSLLNHACKPTAVVSCFRVPVPEDTTLRNIGAIAIHSLRYIPKDQEITIEYIPTIGTLEERREHLHSIGIAKCHCKGCEHEEALSRNPDDPIAVAALQKLTKRGEDLHRFVTNILPILPNQPPVVFYQILWKYLSLLTRDNYNGHVMPNLYDLAISYAKRFNDNVRIFWMGTFLASYVKGAYSKDHVLYQHASEYLDGALNNTIWNADVNHRDFLTFVPGQYEILHSDARHIFMLDQPQSLDDDTYHLLTVNAKGRLEPISREDNFQLVRLSLLALALVEGEEEIDAEAEEAEEAADRAAAELAAEEDAEAAKKEKKRKKKAEKSKRQKERKRAVAAATGTAAVAPTTTITTPTSPPPPAPSLPATPAPSPPSQRPHHNNRNRVRSSSNPEPALIARFLANAPLRPPPSAFRDEDCISESEMEIRFGVQIAGRNGDDEKN